MFISDSAYWQRVDKTLQKLEGGDLLDDKDAQLLLDFDIKCREKAREYSRGVSSTTLRGVLNMALRLLRGTSENRMVGLLKFARWANYMAERRLRTGGRRQEAEFLQNCSRLAFTHAQMKLSGAAFLNMLEGMVAYFGF